MKKLALLFLAGSISSSFVCEAKGKYSGKKPNIIFILTDDQRWDALGYAGNNIIQTPEMDKLAREGTFFRKAFVTTPICAASRASILTGMYERTHGYTFQQGPLQEQYMQLSYPVILNQHGYHTGFFGKFGVVYKNIEKLFDEADIYDRDDKLPNRRGYFYKTIGKDTVHLTRYTGYKAQQFIKNSSSDKPFCLSLSFSAPHAHDNAKEQYFWQEKSNNRYAGVNIPPPALGEEEYFLALPKEVREGYNRLRWTWRFNSPEKYQHSVKGYYRMISEIDDEIGEIRKVLEEKGIADNTVVIFMSDNGYYLGERQLAGKWLMHDNSIQIPMIIFDPRVNKHHDISDIVLNIDITKTILDIAGIKAPGEYQGNSLLSYVRHKKPEKNRKSVLFEHLWELPQIPSSEGIRTDKWKYFRYRFIESPEELYDLENDPLETKNLAQDPFYKQVVDRLRKECETRIKKYTKAKIISGSVPL
ncbi:MAG: sulfatase [Prolixibacteraceae bacterium]|nr:sulfatase [Prolixibacteraceae bacterium]